MKYLLSFVFLISLSLTTFARRSAGPQSGVWRFEINYPNTSVPFLLELEPAKRGWKATLINGKERLPAENVIVNKGKWIIPLQTYQNYLEFTEVSKSSIRGFFVKPNKKPEERIPIVGHPGAVKRFDHAAHKPNVDVTGKWAMEFTESDGTKTEAVLLLDQSGSTLHASIMTKTGDYRYIDGHVYGSEFEAAAFDGVYNFVFKGKVAGKIIHGTFAAKTVTPFKAVKNDKAALPDPLKQTQVEAIDFTFPDINGKNVSLSDYKGKPVIIQIFGSWCPNCIDELGFLAPWYEQNKKRGIEIVGLSFERALSLKDAQMQLTKVVKKREIPYPMLLAGVDGNDTPEKKLPGIKNFISFPTTIFLNREHKVHKVHAGFNGPGTGLYYSEFKNMFEQTVNELLR